MATLLQHQTGFQWDETWLSQDVSKSVTTEFLEFAGCAVVAGNEFDQRDIVVVCVVNDWQ
jgi:hypothetical protein